MPNNPYLARSIKISVLLVYSPKVGSKNESKEDMLSHKWIEGDNIKWPRVLVNVIMINYQKMTSPPANSGLCRIVLHIFFLVRDPVRCFKEPRVLINLCFKFVWFNFLCNIVDKSIGDFFSIKYVTTERLHFIL